MRVPLGARRLHDARARGPPRDAPPGAAGAARPPGGRLRSAAGATMLRAAQLTLRPPTVGRRAEARAAPLRRAPRAVRGRRGGYGSARAGARAGGRLRVEVATGRYAPVRLA